MVRKLNSHEILVEALFRQTEKQKICPYIRKDEHEPYCAKNLKQNSGISQQRRMVCDSYSLQLWCLTQDKYERCIYYQGEPIE